MPVLRTTLDADFASPVAVTDRGVVVESDEAVWRLDADGTRQRLFADPHLITTAGSREALAVVVSDADLTLRGPYLGARIDPDGTRHDDDANVGPSADPAWVTSVRGGPLGGPLRELVRCRGEEAVSAGFAPRLAVAGRTVAAVGCDGRSLVIVDGARRQEVSAGGEVLALGAAGRTVGWIARATDTAPRVVTLLDLDGGTRHQVATLPAGTADEAVTWMSLADDGRWRAVAQLPATPDGDAMHCVVAEQAADASHPTTSDTQLCSVLSVRYTDDGSVDTMLDGLRWTTVHRDRHARVLATFGFPDAPAVAIAPGFATDGHRGLAVVLPRCTDQLILVMAVSRYRQQPRANCPTYPTTRRWPVAANGRVRITVRCPRGCRAKADNIGLAVTLADDTLLNVHPTSDLRVGAGQTGTMTFAGGARLRHQRSKQAWLTIQASTRWIQTKGALTR